MADTIRYKADLALTAALALSLSVNAALSWQLTLARRAAVVAADPRAEQRLEAGVKLPPLNVRTTAGEARTLAPAPGRGLLLYVFSPACSWCERNIDNVKALAAAASASGRYDVVGVSLSSQDLNEHIQSKGYAFPVYAAVNDATARTAYKLASTPSTLLIGPDGRLEEQILGAYSPNLGSSLEKRFGFKLPGIAPPPQQAAAAKAVARAPAQ